MRARDAESPALFKDLLRGVDANSIEISGDPDAGLLAFKANQVARASAKFVVALAQHRHAARALDPPLV
jgi:hypothetical protein